MQNIIQIMANPTRESVLQSIKEYDEIGLDEFSKLYGTGKKSYFDIFYEGKTYLARAVYTRAYNLVNPGKDWNFRDTGSKRSFQNKHREWLQELGFTVQEKSPKTYFDPTIKLATNTKAVTYNPSQRSIGSLMESLENGELRLPDLQRPFLWKPVQISTLIESLYRGYPVGYLMFWNVNILDLNSGKSIGTETKTTIARNLVLDGQQRLTSLFTSLLGKPVKNSKYQEVVHKVSFRPSDETFTTPTAVTLRSPEFIDDISVFFRKDKDIYQFKDSYIEKLSQNRELGREERQQIDKAFTRLSNIWSQQLQVLELTQEVDTTVAEQIFVRINSAGTSLSQSDFILTLLSVNWDEGRKELESFCEQASTIPSDKESSPYNNLINPDVSQMLRPIIMLGFRRAKFEAAYNLLVGKEIDADSSADIVNLEKFKKAQKTSLNLSNWHEYINCVYEAGYLSGDMLASKNVFAFCYGFFLIGKELGVEKRALRKIISRFYFFSSLTARYSFSPESRAESDLLNLRNAKTATDFISAVEEIISTEATEDLWKTRIPNNLKTTSKNSPALKAFFASQILLDNDVLFSNIPMKVLSDNTSKGPRKKLELHHLFPKNILKNENFSQSDINQVANYAYIEWSDNNLNLLKKHPKEYFEELKHEIPRNNYSKILNANALWDDWHLTEYPEFLEKRRKFIAEVIKLAWDKLSEGISFSKKIERTTKTTTKPQDFSVQELIGEGSVVIESQNLELKSSYSWDIEKKESNELIKEIIVRAVASLLNTEGGTLVIGVDDNGNILGIENDLSLISNPSNDKLSRHILEYIEKCLGVQAISNIFLDFEVLNDKTVIRLDINKSDIPIFANFNKTRDKTQDDPKFFIRVGASTRELKGRDLIDYQNKVFNR
jgi:hypothetical protein